MKRPWVLVIGGVDPSMGAGLHADREALRALDLEARTVTTAKTDQDDRAVRSVGEREPWRWQFEALAAAASENPGAMKIGLLPSSESITAARAVCDQMIFDAPDLPIVLDPVLESSSGFAFLGEPGLAEYRSLLQRPVILTPNLDEAARFSGKDPRTPWTADRRIAAAGALLALGLRGVVLKDGHGEGARVRDLVWSQGGDPEWVERPRVHTAEGQSTIRGTGCRFGSFLAGRMALGDDLVQAATAAGDWLAGRIQRGPGAPETGPAQPDTHP